MSIEFAGLPGGGKTTTAQRLHESGLLEPIRINSRFELLWHNIVLLCRHPLRCLYILRTIVSHSSSWWMFWFKFTNLFLQYNAKYRKARLHPRALIDQGHVQGAFSVFESVVGQPVIEAYLSNAFIADKIIFFETPESLRETRMEGRDYILRRKLGEDRMQEKVRVMRANSETLRSVPFIAKRLCVVSSEGSTEEVYRSVSQYI